jgi:uncharacterized protein YjgD (DUF1641 family)
MSTEENTTESSAIVEVSPTTDSVASKDADGLDEIKQETKALIDAISKRAQVEAQAAGELTREAYLAAVRQAREALEENMLFDKAQIEKSVEQIQKDAEKNWQSIVQEVESLGTRLSEAAKAAWEKLSPDSTPKD